jgi:hypothetical protein
MSRAKKDALESDKTSKGARTDLRIALFWQAFLGRR